MGRLAVGLSCLLGATVVALTGSPAPADTPAFSKGQANALAQSFKINRNGHWADWAADAKGGDVISLAAYLAGLSQAEAARELARALGIEPT